MATPVTHPVVSFLVANVTSHPLGFENVPTAVLPDGVSSIYKKKKNTG